MMQKACSVLMRKNISLLLTVILSVSSYAVFAKEQVKDDDFPELFQVIIDVWKNEASLQDVKDVIDRSGDINYVYTSPKGGQSTSLTVAVSRQMERVVQLLLENGADPNLILNKGCTPLGEAISLLNERLIKLLMENGADIGSVSCYSKRKNTLAINRLLSDESLSEEIKAFGLNHFYKNGNSLEEKMLLRMIGKKYYKLSETILSIQPELSTQKVENFIGKLGNDELKNLINSRRKNSN